MSHECHESEYSKFLKSLGIDKEKMLTDMESRLSEDERNRLRKMRLERIEELEKENAELKEKCETLEDMLDEGISYQKAKDYDGVVTSLLEQNHLFTKANLLLENIYKIAMGDWNDPKWHDQVLQKAREYIKEIQEK